MADLPSILGGMAQGFLDFGKSAVDLFGTGGASIADLIESARTGKVTTRNSDDFRKWLYDTNDVKDAAAKGLGTALNGVQTVSDYIPGIGAVTRNPLFNAGQGALGGLADEFKMYGKDYDLGRAGQRAAVGAGGALASTGLADALKGSGNALLKSGTAQGLARGAVGGAIGAGGYTAIDGGSLGDVANSALQGAGMGAALGGTMGALQDFRPAKTYGVALTDEEKAARIANAKNMLANEQDPERIAELNNQIKNLGGTLEGALAADDAAVNGVADTRSMLAKRLSGDALNDALDLADTLRGVGADIDDNGYVTLYHRTTPDAAASIYGSGEMMTKEPDRGIFWSTNRGADSSQGYGDSVVTAKVPVEKLELDDIFDNNADVVLGTNGKNRFNVSDYLVNAGTPSLEQALSVGDAAINNVPSADSAPAATIAGKGRSWDELYDMLSRDAGAFENEDRTLITASPSQLRSEIQAIDAKYPNDLPDDIWDKRYNLNQQLKAAEKGYNSPYDYYVGESKKNFRQDFESRPDKYKAKIADIERQAQRQAALDQDIANASPRKLAQFNLIQQKNPAPNETLTWIRSPKDILTWDEAIAGAEGDNAFTWPDYTLEDALRDQKKHSMTVYSSYPIKGGTFVTPSRQQASDYAGGGRVYSKVIRPDDVAWINGDEGQYAYTKVKSLEKSLSASDRAINDADIMESRIAPGQLGLFDDMPTQTPKTGTRQTSLFDQPQDGLDYYGEDIEAPATTLTNPYAPVDGKLTQAMKDRYWEVMKNADSFSGAIDNELYNKIDQSTLPKGYDKLRQLLDSQMVEDSKVAVELRKGIGTDIPLRADLDKLVEYVYGDEINGKQTFYKDLDESVRLNRKNAPLIGIDAEQAEADAKNSARNKLISRAIEKAERKVIDDVVGSGDSDDILYALQDYRRRGVRTGRAGALDTVLSERLGIAPGNTVKVTNVTDSDRLSSGALGRYARSERNIAVSDMNSPEGKVSTMAHERLHSFQNEARPESAGRYDPEVAEAYKQLQKDLGHYYKSNSEIKKRYKRDVDYWASSGEQESRMFQQYLENKGYTDNSAWRKMGGKADEWGNEINPAFDKFIDKLRDLSKRGVALPALTALFGGGALMANQQKDKEEVK